MKVALKGRDKETFIEPEPDAAARKTAAVVKAPPQPASKVITR
jgi:hypothetical protein